MKRERYFVCILTLLITVMPKIMNAQNQDFIQMVKAAVRAPSGHNTQPWQFKLTENEIEIIPNLTKTLPAVDPNRRELFISLGCATENLCIAASTLGYTTDMQIEENGSIRIALHKQAVQADPLFKQINIRQTDRNVYEYKAVDQKVLQECLQTVPRQESVKFYAWEKGSAEFDTLRQYVMKGNLIQMADSGFKDELKSWMRYNKKDSESSMDGLAYNVFGAPNLPRFISKPVMSSFLNSRKQNNDDSKKIASSSHFVLITSLHDQKQDWILVGRCLERFLLKTTEEGIANAYMNQPCEVEALRNELKTALPIDGRIPQMLLRIGYAKKAAYSKRKNIEAVLVK